MIGASQLHLSGRHGYVLRIPDCVRGSGGLAVVRRSHCKYKQLPRGLADGVEMVVMVPKHTIDLVGGKQSGIARDRIRTIEMEYLQASCPRYGQELAGW